MNTEQVVNNSENTTKVVTEDNDKKLSASSDVEDTQDETNSEDSETTEQDSDEQSDSEAQKPKKKGGFQKRIDKLNAKATLAAQEAEYWKQQYLKSGNKDEPGAKVDDKPSKDASGKPDPDKFETMGEYLEALSDWKVEQKLNQASEKTKAQTKVEEFRKKVNEFAKAHPDFEELVDEVDSRVQMTPTIRDLILDSDVGHKLMYELAKNPEEYERINSLSPLKAAKEIGLIEYRLSKESESKKIEAKKTSSAPAPINPLKGKSGSGIEKSVYDPELSFSEYEALRRKKLSKK